MDSTPDLTLECLCWIYGDKSYTIFSVEIARTETIADLKQVIKNKNQTSLRDVDPDHLALYSIPIPDDKNFPLETILKDWILTGETCLDEQLDLSALNVTSSLVIVHAPDLPMTLNCWVRGKEVDQIFAVSIPSTKTVADLKKVIKNMKQVTFGDIDSDYLALYKVSLPYGEASSVEGLGSWTMAKLVNPLQARRMLSPIFMPLPAVGQLHLIVEGLPASFECWIREAEPAQFVEVQVSMRADIGALESAIKAVYGDVLSPGCLKLYKIPVYEEAEFRKHLTSSAVGSGQLLQAHALVGKVFGDVPFSQKLRVVTELGVKHPSLACSAGSNKREHSEDPVEANKRIRRNFSRNPMHPPPIIAMPSYFEEHYKKRHTPLIRCGRPYTNQSPFPLVLAHPIFATFVSECETYEPRDEDIHFIRKLSSSMSAFFRNENNRRYKFQDCLREYGIDLAESRIQGTDCMTDGDARVGTRLYLISEANKDFGAAKRDPYIQAAAYHLAATRSHLRTYEDTHPLPCIHVFYNGPVLGFAGSMLTDKFDVNVLGPILPLFYHPTDINLQIRSAKMFGALKIAAAALKKYYEHNIASHVDARFPFITKYDTVTPSPETREYTYVEQINCNSLLYICQHIHDKQRILVKFVRTYSKDAHLASAANDGAPTLLGYSVLSCGWSAVAMEFLDRPDWVSGWVITDEAEQCMVRDKVKEHVLTLHQRGFVHGDVRPLNVLVKKCPLPGPGHTSKLSVRLIDFDMAGEINKARYPFLLNMELGMGVRRPSGVKGGGIITTEHDLAMVSLMYVH